MSEVADPSRGGVDKPVARTGLVVVALLAIYLIWGSTYLAIKLAIETLPPLLMAGTRFIVAGAALWLLVPGDRRVRPNASDWKWAFILGALLFLAGNGIVSVVESKMPSGVAALLVTSVPMWMVILEWLLPRGKPPGALVVCGLILGFTGVALLAGSDGGWVGGEVDYWFVAAILFGCLCWALGSLLSRRGDIKLPLLRSVALQMFAGGILLCLASPVRGELGDLDLANATLESWLAWLYLIVFGAIIAFSAYSWLLTVRPSAVVSTYAFVNPVVAVALGWLWLREPLGPKVLAASALIVAAVALITWAKSRPNRPAPPVTAAGTPGK